MTRTQDSAIGMGDELLEMLPDVQWEREVFCVMVYDFVPQLTTGVGPGEANASSTGDRIDQASNLALILGSAFH
jgi:hypothetical protein